MFVLAHFKQTVRVPADKFKLDIDQAISEELNLKFANKVNGVFLSFLLDLTEFLLYSRLFWMSGYA